MNENEKQNSNVLENREYRNQNQNIVNEDAINEQFYGIDEVKTQNTSDPTRNDSDPIKPEQITNDEDDFLNSDYPEDGDSEEDLELDDDDLDDDLEDDDDDDLEEQSGDSFDMPRDDFNETEDTIEDPDYNEEEDENDDDDDDDDDDSIDEDSETDFPEVNSRRF